MRKLTMLLLPAVFIFGNAAASELQVSGNMRPKPALDLETVKSALMQLSNDIDSDIPSNAWISCSSHMRNHPYAPQNFYSWIKETVTRTQSYINSANPKFYLKTSNRFGIHPLFVAAAQISAGDLRDGGYFISLTKDYMQRLYSDFE